MTEGQRKVREFYFWKSVGTLTKVPTLIPIEEIFSPILAFSRKPGIINSENSHLAYTEDSHNDLCNALIYWKQF